jgi:hypothetical protein
VELGTDVGLHDDSPKTMDNRIENTVNVLIPRELMHSNKTCQAAFFESCV